MKQNGPDVTSLFQHYETKQKMSSTISTFDRDHEQVRLEKEALKARSGDTSEEPESGPDHRGDPQMDVILSRAWLLWARSLC